VIAAWAFQPAANRSAAFRLSIADAVQAVATVRNRQQSGAE
jgi:hypothetical protein